MKKLIKLIGFLAIAAIIGLGFGGCSEPVAGLTGTVTIDGSAYLGQVLTANTSALEGSGTISYEWRRGTTGIGWNSETYTVQAVDVGSSITVTVTRSENSGSVTSNPTMTVVGLDAPTPGLAFTLINGGTAYSVSKGTSTFADVVIPAIYNGLPVVEIADSGFSSYENLKSIIIPEGVTKIGNYAFFHCSSLTSVLIPVGLTSIGNFAFNNCNSFTTIFYSGTNNSTWNGILVGANNIPLADATRYYYSEINPGTENTHWRFIGGIPVVYGPTVGLAFTLTDYGTAYSVSRGTANSPVVIIPAVYNGLPVTTIGYNGFEGYANMISIIIPDSVEAIYDRAFSGCTGLTSITIPNSVKFIFSDAFYGCTGLTNIKMPTPMYNSYIYGDAFKNTGIWNNTPNNSVVYADKWAVGYKGSFNYLSLRTDTVSIASGAFFNCTGLTSITIPNSVTHIGSSAFSGCTGLTSITIPNSVTYIGSYTFSRCTSLTSITIPFVGRTLDGRDNGGLFGRIFGDPSESHTRNIPASLKTVVITGGTRIPDSAFSGCAGLTSITMPNSVTYIGSSAFSGCTGLTSITIPDSVTSIGDRAFSGCTSLTNITIPNSVTNISALVFENTGIWNNTPNNSVVYVDKWAVGYKGSFNYLSLKTDTVGIGVQAFRGFSDLTSVTIPNSVTHIGSSAFFNCTGLTSITIPFGVTSIGSSAFSGCTGLTRVFYSGPDITAWNGITIAGGNSLLTNATRYYYSETLPGTANTHWLWVDGIPTVWE